VAKSEQPPELSTGRSVLVVDDDDVFRSRLARALSERGFDAQGARSHEEAMELARAESPEFAVVDLRLPGKSGIDTVRELKHLDPATTVVLLTGYGSIASAVEAVRLGAVQYLSKPVDVDQVLAAFDGAAPAHDASVPSLARVEWEHINRVLTDCGGNISQAARLLGVHRRSLQRKLWKFPVSR
jgi:two-component system response regulator RegA